ncbi:MAG TPA: DNA repair protein RecO [Bacteroidia bacterium]|jgi:DNA repair protein RecO (recombination protein O)
MLHTTRGIVLQTFPYTDSSLVTKIYTEAFGLQSYLANAAHSKRSGTRANLLQPLNLVECVVYKKEKKQLQRIKEIRIEHPYNSIPMDVRKSSIVLFLDEILYRSIHEEEPNAGLFEFVRSSLLVLDLKTGSCADFHLYFLVQLSRYLGFYPSGNFSEEEKYFDMQDGVFRGTEPSHPLRLEPGLARRLDELMRGNYESIPSLGISHMERKALLEKLIQYYELHVPGLREIKSHKVLEEVL